MSIVILKQSPKAEQLRIGAIDNRNVSKTPGQKTKSADISA